MLKYMDLCVQLQQHRQAKDGLHQYRNMAQQQAPGSLEVGRIFFFSPSVEVLPKHVCHSSCVTQADTLEICMERE